MHRGAPWCSIHLRDSQLRDLLTSPTSSRRSSATWGCGCIPAFAKASAGKPRMPRHPVPWPDAVPTYQAGSVFTAVNTEREVMTKKAPVQAPVCRKGSSDQASALLDDK